MGNVYTFLKQCKLVEPRGEMETPAGMTRTCCREAEGRGLSRLHVDTTALTMPAISTAISRCAGRCKRSLVRPDVSGSFGDIVIVFVDNDPAALAVAKACPPALDIRNFQGDPIGLRRLGCEREKRQVRQAIIRVTDGDHDAGPVGSSGLRFRRARVATPRDRDKQSPDRAGTHDSSSYLSAAPAGRSPRRRAPYAPPASRKRDGRGAIAAGAHPLVVIRSSSARSAVSGAW